MKDFDYLITKKKARGVGRVQGHRQPDHRGRHRWRSGDGNLRAYNRGTEIIQIERKGYFMSSTACTCT